LSTTRKGGNIELEKWLSAAWQIQFNFKNEDKNGARLFGRGYDCTTDVCNGSAATQVKNAILLVPEPINSNIKQIDAKVNYHDKQLGLTMGYYGSFYSNLRGSLNPAVPNILNNGLGVPATLYPAVPGGTSLQDVLQSPLALAPDNQAHQFYLDGHYAINPKNKVTFKLAYTHARQNEAFLGMGLPGAPAGVAGLDASVDTWRAQVGVSSRPIDKLWLLANLTYENKDDKTPSQLYNTAGSPPTFWNNYHVTARKFVGKLEASYQMTPEFRGIIGADYKTVDRAVPTNQLDEDIGGLSSMRSENDETAWRVELRRNMSENVNGSLSYSSSKRGGSDWTVLGSTSSPLCNGIPNSSGVPTCYGQQFPASTIIAINPNSPFAVHMADMERNKWKLTADWAPNENLSLNVYLENGEDKNTTAFSPVAGGKGFRNTDYKLYSFDVSYVFSDKWSMTGYASYGDQTQHINHSSGYLLALKNRNDAVGLSVLGKLGSNFHVGANLSYLNDVNEYGINAATSNTGAPASAANQAQAAIGLPDVKFKTTIFNLFGTYALQKHGDLRFDLIHQRTKFVEWTWSNNGVPFAFADNSIVTMQPEQNVTLIGVSYIYRFR
jgi:MtrB/PioB family decaheme-associated outer membrane protein